jgi:hypothetical protein
VGCAHYPPPPYQKASDPRSPETGYYSHPFNPERSGQEPDHYLVVYKCFSPREQPQDCSGIEQLALYRSAELALEKGRRFFMVSSNLHDSPGWGSGWNQGFFPPSRVVMLTIKLLHTAGEGSGEQKSTRRSR